MEQQGKHKVLSFQYWTQVHSKESKEKPIKNWACFSHFHVCAESWEGRGGRGVGGYKKDKKNSTEGKSPSHELQEDPCRRPYLMYQTQKYITTSLSVNVLNDLVDGQTDLQKDHYTRANILRLTDTSSPLFHIGKILLLGKANTCLFSKKKIGLSIPNIWQK